MALQLTIGVSSRALFDLEMENQIFETLGSRSYVEYQVAHEDDILSPGPAFNLVKSLLALNEKTDELKVEVIIMSQNSADASVRIFNSIEYYGLGICRAALTTGESVVPYLKAYNVDLYLSANENTVRAALEAGIPAGKLLGGSKDKGDSDTRIKIAFDGDCVLFSDEAEKVFQERGLEAFNESEKNKSMEPLDRGPFARLLEIISSLQKATGDDSLIRTALVTARCAPAHERAIRTLRSWDVRVDEAFFLGGRDKAPVLEAFGADIFFDDNEDFTNCASKVVLSAWVPRQRDFILKVV